MDPFCLPSQNSVLLAPLAGYTDAPFRQACRRCGLRYAFTPLVDAQAVIYAAQRNRSLLYRNPDEAWLGVQLLGAKPETLAHAARFLNERDFQLLDLNLGCPVPKVRKRGAGAALGAKPAEAARCVEALRRASRFPVSAKIRVQDPADPAPSLELARALVNAGIAMLSVHGRVTRQYYSGPVALDVIRALQEELPIPVVANGGIFSVEDAAVLRAATRCSRLMVARGSIGNPWIFADLIQGRRSPPSHREISDCLEEQVGGMMALYGENIGLRIARKTIAAYLKGRGYSRQMRYQAMQISRETEFRRFVCALRSQCDAEQPCPRVLC